MPRTQVGVGGLIPTKTQLDYCDDVSVDRVDNSHQRWCT